jgi:hypothetical protein
MCGQTQSFLLLQQVAHSYHGALRGEDVLATHLRK